MQHDELLGGSVLEQRVDYRQQGVVVEVSLVFGSQHVEGTVGLVGKEVGKRAVVQLVRDECRAESGLLEGRDEALLPVDLVEVEGVGRTEHEGYALVGGVDLGQHVVEVDDVVSGTEARGGVAFVAVEPPVAGTGRLADDENIDLGHLRVARRRSPVVKVA